MDWWNDADALLERSWECMVRAAEDGTAHRFAALATIGAEGPEARTVALRAADRKARTLSFTADILSRKIPQLRADPRAELLFWFPDETLQVRARGRALIREGPEAEHAWRRVPNASRLNFGGHPATGRAISGPDAFSKFPERDRFAAIDLLVDAVDMVALRADGHRRALWRADSGRVAWLAP